MNPKLVAFSNPKDALSRLVELDRAIDSSESDGIRARWEFGRILLSRRVGKKLPLGVLDELIEATGKSRQELQYRMQFAEKYPDARRLSNALDNHKSWHGIVESFGHGKTAAELLVASNEYEWYTPSRYIEAARLTLGAIDLDPASCEAANRTVQAAAFYSKKDDGLHQPWHGRIWLNPPYGGLAGPFARRLVEEYRARRIDAAITLVNANCTNTAWFQPLWDYLLCFPDHRVEFESAGREKLNNSTHGSVFVYLGEESDRFHDAFADLGAIVARAKRSQSPQTIVDGCPILAGGAERRPTPLTS